MMGYNTSSTIPVLPGPLEPPCRHQRVHTSSSTDRQRDGEGGDKERVGEKRRSWMERDRERERERERETGWR